MLSFIYIISITILFLLSLQLKEVANVGLDEVISKCKAIEPSLRKQRGNSKDNKENGVEREGK